MRQRDDIEARIEALDVSLFDAIETQSLDGDRRAWLAVQRSLRRQPRGYAYLEIGSHLGGSIQQHLVDPLCRSIASIDKRPPEQPDDRGIVCSYEGNSSARMLENLRRVAPEQTGKVTCFDADACDVDPRDLPEAPDFCFIDGEHTHAAVLSDFGFCLRVCAPDAAICLHDDTVVHRAIGATLLDLRRRRVPFVARKLSGETFGVFLRDCPAAGDPYLSGNSQDGTWWLRARRLREWSPRWLRPAGRRVAQWLGRSRHGHVPDAG
jgi:hypothetical protein